MARHTAAPRQEALSLPEVCRQLGVSYFVVYRLILTGALPASQDRRRRYWVTRAAVVELKESAEWQARRSENTDSAGQRRRRARSA